MPESIAPTTISKEFMMFNQAIAAIVGVAMIALIGAGAAAAGEWKGTVTTENGSKVVNNPKAGFKDPSSIAIKEQWRLGGETDNEDEFFGVISDITTDARGNVYLLDAQLNEVKIFTADGKFVRSIGREGEGPGEFRGPSAMFFTQKGDIAILQTMPGKVVLLTPDGTPVGEMPIPQPEDGGWQMLQTGGARDGSIILYVNRDKFDPQKSWQRNSMLIRVDEAGAELATYATKSTTIDFAAAVMSDKAFDTIERRWTIGPSGKVYAAQSYDGYEIHVWNADGSLDKIIRRDAKPRARSADEKEFMHNMMNFWAQRIPGCKVEIDPNCKAVESLYVRDDGSLWVLSADGSRDNPDGTLGLFDVYNADGQFVRNVTLQGEGDPQDDMYLFVGNRIFVVTEFLQAAMVAQGVEGLYDEDDDAGPMEVICYKLDGDVLVAR